MRGEGTGGNSIEGFNHATPNSSLINIAVMWHHISLSSQNDSPSSMLV